MVLTRWDPLFEIRRARQTATRGLYADPERNDRPTPLDIVRDGDNVSVTADLPGVKPEDIVITIEGGVLSIKAETKVEERREDSAYVVRERSTGSFRRSLRLSRKEVNRLAGLGLLLESTGITERTCLMRQVLF